MTYFDLKVTSVLTSHWFIFWNIKYYSVDKMNRYDQGNNGKKDIWIWKGNASHEQLVNFVWKLLDCKTNTSGDFWMYYDICWSFHFKSVVHKTRLKWFKCTKDKLSKIIWQWKTIFCLMKKYLITNVWLKLSTRNFPVLFIFRNVNNFPYYSIKGMFYNLSKLES